MDQTCPSIIFNFPNRQIEEYQKAGKINDVIQKYKNKKNPEFMCLEKKKRKRGKKKRKIHEKMQGYIH